MIIPFAEQLTKDDLPWVTEERHFSGERTRFQKLYGEMIKTDEKSNHLKLKESLKNEELQKVRKFYWRLYFFIVKKLVLLFHFVLIYHVHNLKTLRLLES